MKNRTFQILNILAVNLLLLALYLNFIHKDNNSAPSIPVKETSMERTAASGIHQPNTIPAKRSAALN